MSNSPVTSTIHLSEEVKIWDSLKQAIAESSGFQRWQLEAGVDCRLNEPSLDRCVRHYLRETLATLAY